MQLKQEFKHDILEVIKVENHYILILVAIYIHFCYSLIAITAVITNQPKNHPTDNLLSFIKAIFQKYNI